ncbi:PEGA domain-containing protein [Myxococcus sp. RHSTA-1-4]|uniref:PEGA domain-containing protein n=1 Tax=Myxococcus sp. RHSTA-1-4 TaxID=2874601 RepID=UPI001CBE92AA|nr:PEGA domain-containing protein [Myxococcus sp. RHSTA-1-4]MBZ4416675.1 PEGA domain-containing protein [Myxococcus sp. RHSTA-1-4]
MSNEATPASGRPVYEGPEGDTWSKSLMGRTEELGHVQAQAGPVHTRPPSTSEPRDVPVPGTPAPRAGAAPGSPAGARQSPRVRPAPQPPPPAPARPLAAALRLGSACFGVLAAVLLVLPELQRVSQSSADENPALPEQTLAPRFDTAAPVREGEVREQRAPIEGTSLLIAESEPTGATVSVDGVKQGTTPLSLTLECTPGAPLRVKFVRKGFDSVEHTTVCRADTMTELSTRLRRSRGGARP